MQGIDAVIGDVNNMLQGVRTADFNVFDRELSLEWQALVTTFREQNAHAKDATRNLIDTSFRKLRSAEGAFELLQNFKSIQSQGAIKEQMESKLQDILEQFSREIDSVASIFDSQRCALPVHVCPTARSGLRSHAVTVTRALFDATCALVCMRCAAYQDYPVLMHRGRADGQHQRVAGRSHR